MRSYWMQMAGASTVLELRDVAVPEPAPRQLLVRMHAASLNRGEFLPGHGTFGKPGTWKAIGGEGAGEVVAAGSDVREFRPGDRVMGRCTGAFADYALMEAGEAMTVPATLSWEEASAIPLTYLVAFDMLVQQGRLAAGEWLLVNGVSSGVGVASLQLAKTLDARVIGTSGSSAKLAALLPLGLDVGICTRQPDFAAPVLEATAQRGADLVVNAVGGSMFGECLRALAFEGRLATVGFVDGAGHADIDLSALHSKRLTVFGVSNKMRSPAHRAKPVPDFIRDMLPAFAGGRIKPIVDRVFAFEQLGQAREHMQADRHLGKIVLAIAAGRA